MTEQVQAHHSTQEQGYNPNNLIDRLLKKMNLKNDAALSRKLEIAPPVISKVRHFRLAPSASLLLRMHEVSGMSIRDLQDLMGDRRAKYRLSHTQGKVQTNARSAPNLNAGA